jgi:hypothetical protein
MPKKLSPEHKIIAAHIAATTAAFQVLVHCLQENGALEPGQRPAAILTLWKWRSTTPATRSN